MAFGARGGGPAELARVAEMKPCGSRIEWWRRQGCQVALQTRAQPAGERAAKRALRRDASQAAAAAVERGEEGNGESSGEGGSEAEEGGGTKGAGWGGS